VEKGLVSQVVYLYGFVPPAAALPAGGLTGVAGCPVRLRPLDGFAAAYALLPAADYDAERVEARTADLAWVGEQGLAHERVVAWFVDHAEIVPAPLFTLYSSEDAMARAAVSRADPIRGRLERFAGRREWDLKVSYDAAEVRRHAAELDPEVGALDREMASAAPGRRFLLERRRAELLQGAAGAAARREAAALLEAVDGVADEIRVLPIPEGEVQMPVVLHAAALVSAGAEDALMAAVGDARERLDGRGIRVDASGPWAPYRFVAEPDDG
jgi:hypothetical protein